MAAGFFLIKELDRHVSSVAANLHACGIKVGDVVAVALDDSARS